MDRKSFLVCQPFLYPLSSSSLPTDHDSSSYDSSTKCCQEVLLDGMNLSIEPCENTRFAKPTSDETDMNTNEERQNSEPAYFLSQKSTRKTTNVTPDMHATDSENGSANVTLAGEDPAFCKVKLILHTAKLPVKGMTTPDKKVNRRDLREIDDQVEGSEEVILIADIDGDLFQIDLNRLLSTSVGQSEDRLSTFLVLEMPSCCFRIFTQKALENTDNHTSGTGDSSLGIDDTKSKFDAIHCRLETLWSSNFLLPFPLSYSGQIVPDSSQKHSGRYSNDDPVAFSRRCLHSYSRSWNNLITFDTILEYPRSADSIVSITERSFRDTMSDLISEIPKDISSSFIKEDYLAKAAEIYEEKVATKIDEFESVLEDFWNEKADLKGNNKRRREDFELGNRQDECPGQYAEILRDHKKYIVSKHELFLLPRRG